MTDVTTNQPLRVSTDGTAGPYIMVPLSQLEEIQRLLKNHNIRLWTEENAISLNGAPYIAVVNLGYQGDAEAVQVLLDRVG